MAAERNLSDRGKPSKPELSIRQRLNESCLGQVKFGGNGLANLVRQLAVHQHHGSRVASKCSGTESVNHHVLVFHHLNFDSALSFHHHNLSEYGELIQAGLGDALKQCFRTLCTVLRASLPPERKVGSGKVVASPGLSA